MLYRDFGKTGFQVSAIGLGTWNIGNQWGSISEPRAIATIRSAIDHGINLIDTAESYGIPAGLSEERLGKALVGVRNQVHIVSKIGRWGRRTGQMVPMTTPDMVRLCTHASLYRLKTDYIDVMLCHEGKLSDPHMADAYLDGFEQLQQQGLIRTFGISTDRLEVLELFNARDTCRVVEVDYSLLSRNPEKAFFPYCQKHNIAVLARGPLHKGLLSGKYTSASVFTDTVRAEWYKSEQSKAKLARKLMKVENLRVALAANEETTEAMVNAALRFVTSHEIAPVAIAGAKSPSQATTNARAGQSQLSPEERAQLIQQTKLRGTHLAIA
ncbi:MAG: aldo/keto reductase [Cyanobacteria bacterium J06629_19]